MEPGELHADVAIVGAGLAGLVAGAILARRGRRVVVLEHAPAVGGRGGAVPVAEGYWLSFGEREGHDVGDCQLPWHYGAEAAREADVELALRPVGAPLRLHRFPEGTVLDGGQWGAEGFLAAARDFFECPADGLDELVAVMRRLAAASPEEVDAAIPETLGGWLPANVRHPGVRRALLLMATVIFHPHPEEASVGRLMRFLQAPRAGGPFIPDDPAAGGMQGLMEPWARALAAHGGTVALGWKPVEIIADGGRVAGAVAVDRASRVLEVRAPVVVCTYPAWELLDLVDARLLPPDFVETARALAAHRADLVGWTAALRRLPTIRATGEAEQHAGWNRFLVGPERTYRGGYQITSLTSTHAAPAGRHLLELVVARFFRGGTTAGQPWTVARREIDEAVDYLRRFYADLDACCEWSTYRYVPAPQSMSWAWAPVRRHGLELDGVDGLLLAGPTLEAPAAIVDHGAYAGLAAARRALAL